MSVLRNLETLFFLSKLAHGFLSTCMCEATTVSPCMCAKRFKNKSFTGVERGRGGGVQSSCQSPGDEVVLGEGSVADAVGVRVQFRLEGAPSRLLLSAGL